MGREPRKSCHEGVICLCRDDWECNTSLRLLFWSFPLETDHSATLIRILDRGKNWKKKSLGRQKKSFAIGTC